MLTTDDDVVAKINVQYSSYIVTYETDADGYDVAKLGSKPKKVTTLTVSKAPNSSIDVTWNAPSNEHNLQYELVWNNGVGDGDNAQYVPLTQPYTFALKYNRGNLRPGKTYMFKVRAINSCGSGEFSDAQTLSINTAPKRPDIIEILSQSYKDECGFNVKWGVVDDGGLDITNYYIQIIGGTTVTERGNVDMELDGCSDNLETR